MEGAYTLIVIVLLHCVLFFLDVLFRSCCHLPYICLLQNLGLEVSFLRLQWHTTALNRVFQQWSNWKPQLQAVWFSIGVIVSLMLMPVAAFLVLRGLFGSISEESKETSSGFKLEPVVPGVNLPMSQLGNYMTALAVGGVLHELGHALAAGREGITILGCRAHLIIMLPVAAVEISTQRLNSLPSWRRLRILCAGVWHNVVLSLVALMLLYAISHSPLYKLDQGVVVTSVDQESGVFGPAGLFPGDHLVSLDHCLVRDKSSWRSCLYKTAKQAQTDFCLPATFLSGKKPQSPEVPCCSAEMLSHLCFTGKDLSGENLRWCLRVREVVEAAGAKSGSVCAEKHVSLTPQLDATSPNGTRLTVIHRSNTKEPAVLFLGSPSELHQAIEISNWVPTASYLSPYGPELLYNSFSYTAALSAGLALLNLLPCYGFDGQHIFNLLSELALGACGVRSPTVTSTVAAGFTAVGTGCLLAWLFTAVRKLILF